MMTNRASILSLLSLVLLCGVACTTAPTTPSDNPVSGPRSGASTATRLKFPEDKLIEPENCLIPEEFFPPRQPLPDLSSTAGRWGNGYASSMALSPDGMYLAIGTSIGIDIYHTDTLDWVWSQPTESLVTELTFSPDSQMLVSMSEFVVTWDVQTGEQIQEIVRLPNAQMNFSADGSILAVTRGCTIFWDTQTWQPINAINGYAASAAFSPDDALFVEGLDGGAAIIWDIKTGRQKYIFNEESLLGDDGFVTEDTPIIQHIVFSPDGSLLALGSVVYWGGTTLSVLDSRSGDSLFETFFDTNESGGLAFNSDGTQIAAVSSIWEGITTIWDIESGDELATLTQEPTALVLDVEWSPDGTALYTVAGAYAGAWEHPITAWYAQTYQAVEFIEGYTGMILHVGWSPTGEQIAISPSDHPPILLDSETLEPVRTLDDMSGDYAFSYRWSPDGGTLAAWAYNLHATLWDTSTGEQIANTDPDAGSVWGVTYADEPIAFIERDRGQLAAINIETGDTLYTLPTIDLAYAGLGVSDDGKLLAWLDGETDIIVWDTQEKRSITRLSVPVPYIEDPTFSPDNTLLAVLSDNGIIVWDITTRQMISRFMLDVPPMTLDYANHIAFNPEGSQIAAGYEAHQVVIWDVESGEPLYTFAGHSAGVTGVAWSPDSKQLASVSIDGTLIVWDIPE